MARKPGGIVARADDECQSFQETGYKVCGRFLQYWRDNGGLTQQGLPISEVFEEKNAAPPAGDGQLHQVQYFQRARFEQHIENQPPYDVLLGLLGREQLTAKYNGGNYPTQPGSGTKCQTFGETGQSVCDDFLAYWQNKGGLTQQGLPISPILLEQNAAPPAGDGQWHRVQYFQRARFELHQENQPPYNVLLGLLGAEQYGAKYKGAAPSPVAPPPPVSQPTPAPTPPLPAPVPTPTPTPPPAVQPIPASGCFRSVNDGSTTVQSCVSNASPTQNSTVSVSGRLVVGGKLISGASMETTWHYKTTTSSCSATSGSDGIASCSRSISRATKGYYVRIDVVFSYNGQTYSDSTGFTPQ